MENQKSNRHLPYQHAIDRADAGPPLDSHPSLQFGTKIREDGAVNQFCDNDETMLLISTYFVARRFQLGWMLELLLKSLARTPFGMTQKQLHSATRSMPKGSVDS